MSATFDRFLEHVLDVHNERRQPEGERFVAMSATFNRGDFNLIRSVADKNNEKRLLMIGLTLGAGRA